MKGVSYTWLGLQQGALKTTLRIAGTKATDWDNGRPTPASYRPWEFFVIYHRKQWHVNLVAYTSEFVGMHSFPELKPARAYARSVVQRALTAHRLTGEPVGEIIHFMLASDKLRP